MPRFMVPSVVLVVDEPGDMGFRVVRTEIIVQKQDVLHRTVIPLDLPPGSWCASLRRLLPQHDQVVVQPMVEDVESA